MTTMHVDLDEGVADALRRKAREAGKAPEELLAEAAAKLAAAGTFASGIAPQKTWILKIVESAKVSGGNSRGWKWNRDELYDR